jgi:hypothetical protein
MEVVVDVLYEAEDRPPAGAPIRVEVRDTTLQDVAATTLGRAAGQVRRTTGQRLDTVRVVIARVAPDTTIWAHVDVDRDGRVSKGDFVTMSSYPVRSGEAPLRVTVRRV